MECVPFGRWGVGAGRRASRSSVLAPPLCFHPPWPAAMHRHMAGIKEEFHTPSRPRHLMIQETSPHSIKTLVWLGSRGSSPERMELFSIDLGMLFTRLQGQMKVKGQKLLVTNSKTANAFRIWPAWAVPRSLVLKMWSPAPPM